MNVKPVAASSSCPSALIAGILLAFAPSPGEARILNVPNDYALIQTAVDSARANDTVLVDRGVYTLPTSIGARSITLASRFILSGDSVDIDSTILDGGNDEQLVNVNGNDRMRVVIEGFTIRQGRAFNGGAINMGWIRYGKLANLKIEDNTATSSGGGVYCYNVDTLIVTDVVFQRNNAGNSGGGLMIRGCRGEVLLERLNLLENHAETSGGGINVHYAPVRLLDCVISGNESRFGGGLFCDGGEPLNMNRCLITNNSAIETGGGVAVLEAEASLNCLTSMGNSANDGQSIWFDDGTNLRIANSIVRDIGESRFYCNQGGTANVFEITYTDFSGTENQVIDNGNAVIFWRVGNIVEDPLFRDPENLDFRLMADSPCIDTGHPDSTNDADGTRVDMGALHFHQRDIDVEPLELLFDRQLDSIRVTVTNSGGTHLTFRVTESEAESPFFLQEVGEADVVIPPYGEWILCVYSHWDEEVNPIQNYTISSDDPDEPQIIVSARGVDMSTPSDPISPFTFHLSPPYPNPFNSSTTIHFSTGINRGAASLKVYALDGKLAAELWRDENAGAEVNQTVVWNAGAFAAGVYIVKLESEDQVASQKVVLIR